jgi:hypothetical protein
MELLLVAIRNMENAVSELREVLEDETPSEELAEDAFTPSEGFENLHDAMKVYADQFALFEGHERNGYGTVSVEWAKG